MLNTQYVIHRFSKNIDEATSLQTSEVNPPKADEILIKHKYVGINALYDRELYRGAVPYIDVEFPYTFGVEAVGIVEAIGSDVTAISPGDAVGTLKVGTAYQEYQTVHQDQVIPIPEASAEYLTLIATGVSAYMALEELADLHKEERVIVSAAAGGLGHILIQLCKMKGANVVGICGTEDKVNLLTSLDCCDQIINHSTDSVEAIINAQYANAIDVAFDSVGRNIYDCFLKNLATKGRLIIIGLASELSSESFEERKRTRDYTNIYWKGASIRCFMNHLYKDKHQDARNHLFDLYKNQSLKLKVDETSFIGIEAIKDASNYLLAGKSCGKVVVKI